MLCHPRRRHGQQNAVGIDEANLLPLAHKRNRRALHNIDANLIGKEPHHGGALHPRNLLKLLAAFAEMNKEDVLADVFAKHRKHLRARYLGQARGLNVACARDAEARVALEPMRRHQVRGDEGTRHKQRAKPEKDAPHP